MTEEHLIEDEIFEDELEQVWLVAEAPSRDIAEQLADLHTLKGARIMGTVLPIHFYTPHNMRYPSSQQAISGRAACLSLKGQKR